MGLIGAHVSIAGGISKAIERGESLHCDAIQIFTQSSRTWKAAKISEADAKRFTEAFRAAERVKRIIAHNSYLLNISTSNSTILKQSIRLFIAIHEQCELLGIESLVTHPGSHRGEGVISGIQQTTRTLNEVLSACSGFKTRILLENTAGQGDCIGSRFDELGRIVDGLHAPERIGFCFDTQHAFAAGYDLTTPSGYDRTFYEWDAELRTRRIEAFHLNDAIQGLGSRVDRHANIGKGKMGSEPFRFLLNDKRFHNVPMCLETNPGEYDAEHKKDLTTLRALIESK